MVTDGVSFTYSWHTCYLHSWSSISPNRQPSLILRSVEIATVSPLAGSKFRSVLPQPPISQNITSKPATKKLRSVVESIHYIARNCNFITVTVTTLYYCNSISLTKVSSTILKSRPSRNIMLKPAASKQFYYSWFNHSIIKLLGIRLQTLFYSFIHKASLTLA